MAEPADVHQKTFTGYLSFEKKKTNKSQKRHKEVPLHFAGGGVQ